MALVAGGLVIGRLTQSSGGGNGLIITPQAVERRTLSDVITVNGEVRREEILRVLSPITGRVSELSVVEGQSIEAGDRVFAIDGRSSIAVEGEFPFYRSLQVGSEGRDVLQLETILDDLGYPIEKIDEVFDEETRLALGAWQAAQGYGTLGAETEETVSVSLAPNTSGYTIGRANSAAFTIVPGQAQSLRKSSSSGLEISISYGVRTVAEGSVVTLGFSASTRFDDDVTFEFTIGGSALEGVDFESVPRSLVMDSSTRFTSIDILTYSDEILEGDEDIVVSLLPGSGYRPGNISKARIVIEDSSASTPRAVSVSTDVAEVDEGSTVVFTFRATAEANRDLPIEVAFGGTATPGEDYVVPTQDQLTIRAGSMSTDVSVRLRSDELGEPRETLTVTVLANSTNDLRTASVPGSEPSATVEILSGETPEIVLTGGGRIPEGRSGSFVILADEPVSEDTSINYQIGGTATPGVDYAVLTGTVIMRAGSDRVSITVRALDDDVVFQPTDMLVADWPVVVGDVPVEVGDQLSPGSPILVLSEPSFAIVLTVGAAERSELEVGQSVEVDLTVGDQLLSGTIASLDESATIGPNGEETFEGIVTVVGEFSGVDGASVTVDVVLDEVVDVLAVPVASILRTADGDIVRIVNDEGTISRVPVTIGLIDREWAQIVSGLTGGELVIVDIETEGRVAESP